MERTLAAAHACLLRLGTWQLPYVRSAALCCPLSPQSTHPWTGLPGHADALERAHWRSTHRRRGTARVWRRDHHHPWRPWRHPRTRRPVGMRSARRARHWEATLGPWWPHHGHAWRGRTAHWRGCTVREPAGRSSGRHKPGSCTEPKQLCLRPELHASGIRMPTPSANVALQQLPPDVPVIAPHVLMFQTNLKDATQGRNRPCFT